MGRPLCSVWILSPDCLVPLSFLPRSLRWCPPQAGAPLAPKLPGCPQLEATLSASPQPQPQPDMLCTARTTATRHALGSALHAPVHALVPHLRTGRSLLPRNSEPCAPVKAQDDLPFPESFPRQELVQLAFILSVCLSACHHSFPSSHFLPLSPSHTSTHTHSCPYSTQIHTLMFTHRHTLTHSCSRIDTHAQHSHRHTLILTQKYTFSYTLMFIHRLTLRLTHRHSCSHSGSHTHRHSHTCTYPSLSLSSLHLARLILGPQPLSPAPTPVCVHRHTYMQNDLFAFVA